jgi:hypothetical protein
MNGTIDPNDLEEKEPKGNALKVPIKVIPKSLRPEVAAKMVDAILKSFDEFEAIVILRQLKDVSDEAAKQIVPKIIDAMIGIEKEKVVMGATISLRGGKKDWDYCDDPELARLETEKERITDEIKQRQMLLQSMKADIEEVNPATGETNTIHKAKQQNAPTIVAVSFPE